MIPQLAAIVPPHTRQLSCSRHPRCYATIVRHASLMRFGKLRMAMGSRRAPAVADPELVAQAAVAIGAQSKVDRPLIETLETLSARYTSSS